ncbi:MAG: glycosyltransferase, partial [Magnetococcales bacterium]|nr:glycosyltransferase [Magnetococcales bacterium]
APPFALAIPVKNGVEALPSALASLRWQDGLAAAALLDASGDPRVAALAEAYPDLLVHRRHAAADGGQSAAILEGWDALPGEFVGWLNADDLLYPGALARVLEAFRADPELDVVYGHAAFVDAEGAFIGYFPSISDSLEALTLSCVICQPAAFVRRRALAGISGLDPRRHYTMDWDLWLQLRQAGRRFRRLDHPLAAVRLPPDSKTLAGGAARRREIGEILQRGAPWSERLRARIGHAHFLAHAGGRPLAEGGWRLAARLLALAAPPVWQERGAIFGLERRTNRVMTGEARIFLPWLRGGPAVVTLELEGLPSSLNVTLDGQTLPLQRVGGCDAPGRWRGELAPRPPGVLEFRLRAETTGWRVVRLALHPDPLRPAEGAAPPLALSPPPPPPPDGEGFPAVAASPLAAPPPAPAPGTAFCAVIDPAVPKAILAHALVASWHRRCRDFSALHLVLTGADPALERRAAALGATLHHRPPHPQAGERPNVNKRLAAGVDFGAARVILVDWDVLFTGDPWQLRALPRDRFAAAPATMLRLPRPLQQWIVDRFHPPLGFNLALGALGGAALHGEAPEAIASDRYLRRFRYFNGGVVAFPAGRFHETMERWGEMHDDLRRLVPEAARACGDAAAARDMADSDQTALALVLAHEPVHPLDPTHNFILYDLTGGVSSQEVALLHLASRLPELAGGRLSPALPLALFDRATRQLAASHPETLPRFSRFHPAPLRAELVSLIEDYGLRDP